MEHYKDFYNEEPDEGVAIEGCTVVAETELAYLLEIEGVEVWIPKSQIFYQDVYERGETGTFTIPEWLAEAKEIL